MDTDSAYMALSDSLPLVVRPELRKDFWLEYGNWFPPPFCEQPQTDFVLAKMESIVEVNPGLGVSVAPLSYVTTQEHRACSRWSLREMVWWRSTLRLIVAGMTTLASIVAKK